MIQLITFAYLALTASHVAGESQSVRGYKTYNYNYGTDEDMHAPRNLIMMIPDGASPNVFTMARTVLDSTMQTQLHIDPLLSGTVQTHSNTSLVTDSAAAATAYSSGVKTYYGSIGLDMNKMPVGTILEAAKAKGMVVGMVVTSRVTHATPASFAAHVEDREMEDEIAQQYVQNKNLDFLMGGGSKHFTESQLNELRQAGYSILNDESDLDAYYNQHKEDGHLRAFGLFSDTHHRYEVDRHQTRQPSLHKTVDLMTKLLLKNPKAQKNGYFMLVEGSRIDFGGHDNDPVAMAHDAIEFDRAVKVVKDLATANKNTAMISAADHGTGGMTLGINNIYKWEPSVLQNKRMSTEYMMERILNPIYQKCKGNAPLCEQKLFDKALGLLQEQYDVAPTEQELGKFKSVIHNMIRLKDPSTEELRRAMSHAVSFKALIGWTTTGHTGTDVNLYCLGPQKFEHMCKGMHDNTYLNQIMNTFLESGTQQMKETLRLRNMAL